MKIRLSLWELDPEGFHIVIDARLYDRVVRLLIDTGANHSCLDQGATSVLLQVDSLEKERDELNVGIGGNAFETEIIQVDGLRVGRMSVPTMPMRLIDLAPINATYAQVGFPPVQGILGGDFLRKFKAVIDYDQKSLTLTKPR